MSRRRPRRGTYPTSLAYASLLEALRHAGSKRGRHRARLAANRLHRLAVKK